MAKAPPSSASASDPNSALDRSITRSDKIAAQALLWALRPLSNLHRPMPLPFMTAFLMVALDEGKGVNDYARAVGIHRAAMSRNLHAIGDRARNRGPGLGLVTIEPHPANPIKSRVFLTAKGRSIADQMFQQLRKTLSRGDQS